MSRLSLLRMIFVYLTTAMTLTSFCCEIYVIRHGETDWNKQGKVQGHTNIPLNEEGERQAVQLGATLGSIKFSKVFSSDLSRAYRTAELVLNSYDGAITTIPELRERAMGAWEGRLISELMKFFENHENLDNLSREEYAQYKFDESIESYAAVYQRVLNCTKLVAGSSVDGPVLFVSHGGVLRAILYCLDFRPGFRRHVGNGAYIKLRVGSRGQISIMETNGVKCVSTKESTMPF